MEQLGITVFDVAVIAVAVFGAAIGVSSGFAHAVLFIASWIAAGWIAVHFSNLIQPQIQQLVGNPELAYFVSMLVVFVGGLIALVMLTNAFSRAIRASPLAKPDRILGAGFGALCAWVVMGTTFLFYSYLGPKQLPPAVEGGATFPMIKDMANFVEPYLPPGFRTRLQQKPADSMPDLTPAPQTAPPPATTTPTENKQSQ
ncbi:CvpA family protein [Reyranella sp.]|jgi:membrane protein required for colicin V production|uniref:CvpA family protein n=1 Tax=Reyranella sp. TaxID=1929291 RepID=UPI002F940B20